MCEEGAPGQGGGTVGVTVEGDLRGVKAGCDGVVVGGQLGGLVCGRGEGWWGGGGGISGEWCQLQRQQGKPTS